MSIGAFGENFPYTNFHDLNLDWIIQRIKELNDKFDEAISAKIKFADPIEWDITKQYEQLTIVIDDNKAYLSMQPVPSGVPITDTDYWQNVFDMSELVQMQEDYEQEMTGKFDDLEEDLRDEIGDFEDQIEEDVQRIENECVKNNSTKHLLYIGDSYSTYYSGALFTQIVAGIGIPANQCHSVAVSGASFSDATNSYLMQAQGYTGDKNEITDILIVGGINDALISFDDHTLNTFPDTSVLTNAIDAFKTYCDTNYPNAKLTIAYVGGCTPDSSLYTSYHPARSQMWSLWGYTMYAGSHGYNVLETWNAIHTSRLNYRSDDLIHPSQSNGVPAIADAVARTFNGLEYTVNRPALNTRFTASGKGNTNIDVNMQIVDNEIVVTAQSFYIQIKKNEIVDYENWSEIADTSGNAVSFAVREPIYIPVSVAINQFNGVNTPRIVNAELKFENGRLYIRVYSLNGSSYETLTAGNFASITFPALPAIQIPVWNVN